MSLFQLAATISALPESAATATKAQIGEREGKIRNVERLEQIKEEQRKINEESLDISTAKVSRYFEYSLQKNAIANGSGDLG